MVKSQGLCKLTMSYCCYYCLWYVLMESKNQYAAALCRNGLITMVKICTEAALGLQNCLLVNDIICYLHTPQHLFIYKIPMDCGLLFLSQHSKRAWITQSCRISYDVKFLPVYTLYSFSVCSENKAATSIKIFWRTKCKDNFFFGITPRQCD